VRIVVNTEKRGLLLRRNSADRWDGNVKITVTAKGSYKRDLIKFSKDKYVACSLHKKLPKRCGKI
jgi:hypothetical protein